MFSLGVNKYQKVAPLMCLYLNIGKKAKEVSTGLSPFCCAVKTRPNKFYFNIEVEFVWPCS